MDQLIDPKSKLIATMLAQATLPRPFVLIDVGASMGISPAWDRFGDTLVAYGIDPMTEEIDRLRRANDDSRVSYHAHAIGLPTDHSFSLAERQGVRCTSFSRTSTRALKRKLANEKSEHGPAKHYAPGNFSWRDRRLSTERMTLQEFVQRHSIASVDFVKVDTDGADLEAVISAERMTTRCGVLGMVVEARFSGSYSRTENLFSNLDFQMRQMGFKLFNLSAERMSRAALPMPFQNRWPGKTVRGPLAWGDFLYLRDPVDVQFSRHCDFKPSPDKLLKLVCLFDLFGLPDCAAELAVARRTELAARIDVDWLLNELTPPLGDEQLSYQEYVERFYEQPEAFMPSAD